MGMILTHNGLRYLAWSRDDGFVYVRPYKHQFLSRSSEGFIKDLITRAMMGRGAAFHSWFYYITSHGDILCGVCARFRDTAGHCLLRPTPTEELAAQEFRLP